MPNLPPFSIVSPTLDAAEVGPFDTSGAWMLNQLVSSLQEMGKVVMAGRRELVKLQSVDPTSLGGQPAASEAGSAAVPITRNSVSNPQSRWIIAIIGSASAKAAKLTT